jgi:hypothetical protein
MAADISDRQGRVGWPDGVVEQFPEGITNDQILAFHAGLPGRLGIDSSELILVDADDIGIETLSTVCGTAPQWISLVVSRQYSSSRNALQFCSAQGLPDGECAARLIGPDTDFVLPNE